MKKICLIFMILNSLVSFSQELKIPIERYIQNEMKDSFFIQVQKESFNLNKLDSLLSAKPDELNKFVNLAHAKKHDSLYNVNLYELIDSISTTKELPKLIAITNQIVEYENDALVALQKLKPTDNYHLRYWKKLIIVLILGYNIDNNIVYNYDRSNSSKTRENVSFIKSQKSKLRRLLIEWIVKFSKKQDRQTLHAIAVADLKKGKLARAYRAFLQRIVIEETQNKREDMLNDYSHLLEDIHLDDAKWLIQTIGSGSGNSYYPDFLLKMLNHSNEEFIKVAMDWSTSCWDKEKKLIVKNRIEEIFYKNEGELKYKASFILMHDFDNPDAINYLLQEVQLNQLGQRRRTLYWIGDACNSGNFMTSKMDNILHKYLQSNDKKIQRAAIECYLTYSGENMLKAIIPFLDYELDFIARRIEVKIKEYPDKTSLKEILNKRIKKEQNETIKTKMKNILVELKK